MASRYLRVAATTGDALADEEIRNVPDGLHAVNMYASCVTKTDEIGLRLGNTVILDNGVMNIEDAADRCQVNTDQLVFNTVVGKGTLKVPVPTLTTELQFLISVEPVL